MKTKYKINLNNMYDLNIVALHYHGVTYDELDEQDKLWISEEVF